MQETDKRFFFQGKYFDKEEDFWKYVNDWPSQKLDLETFTRLWQQIGVDVWVNLEINDSEITNGSMNAMLQENFLHLLQNLREYK